MVSSYRNIERMKFGYEVLLLIVAVIIIYQLPEFVGSLTRTLLGRLLLTVGVVLVSMYYGRNAGILAALLVILLLMTGLREGMDEDAKVPEQTDEPGDGTGAGSGGADDGSAVVGADDATGGMANDTDMGADGGADGGDDGPVGADESVEASMAAGAKGDILATEEGVIRNKKDPKMAVDPTANPDAAAAGRPADGGPVALPSDTVESFSLLY
jgi:hypothetical protein